MHFVIIGANAAGLSAAVRIKKLCPDAKITVFEKTEVVSFGACGIPYYVGNEFENIDRMTARAFEEFIKSGIDIQLFIQAIAFAPERKEITVQNTRTEQTNTVQYDKLLISSGASPIKPTIKGIDLPNVYTMHSRHDAQQIKNKLSQIQNIVIIGAGFIGLEAAEAFRHQGKNVTIVELSDRILSKTFDSAITELLEAELTKHHVIVAKEEQVIEITDNTVITNKQQYPADMVILAAGFKPNTEFLTKSPLALSPQKAIIIDQNCQTNLLDVYAAGDCATVPHKILGNQYIPLATTANKLGRLAGEIMSGKSQQFIGTLGSSGIRLFGLEAGRTGITENEAKENHIDYSTVFIKDKNHTDYVPSSQTDLWVKLIYEKNTRKILGAQACGTYQRGTVHRVDALAVAIYSGLTVEELGYMDFIYAPPFARTWDVLNIAGNVAK